MGREFVLITGVSSGIGYHSIKYLIDRGYAVIGTVRKEADKVRLVEEFSDHFFPLVFDVVDKKRIEECVGELSDILKGNKLKALVNNAGIAKGGPIELLSEDDFRQQMEVNLFAVRNVTNAFLPFLKGDHEKNIQGGKIIMISSISGYFNSPFNGAYCISKHAMESLGEIYRRELYMYNIDVVSIQAGPIASKIWEKNIDKCKEYLSTDYSVLCKRADSLLRKSERRALQPEVVSARILKILKKKSKTAYVINSNLLATIFFTKVLPKRWVDKILYNQFFKTKQNES